MLAITPQMRILVAVEAVDFRKGIDSLALISVKGGVKLDHQSGEKIDHFLVE